MKTPTNYNSENQENLSPYQRWLLFYKGVEIYIPDRHCVKIQDTHIEDIKKELIRTTRPGYLRYEELQWKYQKRTARKHHLFIIVVSFIVGTISGTIMGGLDRIVGGQLGSTMAIYISSMIAFTMYMYLSAQHSIYLSVDDVPRRPSKAQRSRKKSAR